MNCQNLYIDIFAGCGGLSLGLCNAGWTGLFAIEKNAAAFSTLEHNLITNRNHFIWPDWLPVREHDINELLKNYKTELLNLQGKVKLVAGGPPCQGFSMAGKRDKNDPRNKLIKSYIKFIKLVKPEAIIFENVHGFTVEFKTDDGKTKKYSSYVQNALKRLGYKTDYKIIDMSEYGVPQKRKRFIMVGLLNDQNPKVVFEKLIVEKETFFKERNLSPFTSVYDAINDLEKRWGAVDSPDTRNFKAGVYGKVSSSYQQYMRKSITEDNNVAVDSHRFVNHTVDIIALHKNLLEIAPRGKRITPSDGIVQNLNKRGVTVLDRRIPAPTITSIPDDLLHYEEPRILSVREHARLQSFPDWYKFKGKYTTGGKLRKLEVPRYTQVGNAVPPLFAEQIGLVLKEVLEDERN
jgi:DNA (cytosine-5)-methyltransferase 1